MRLPEAARTPHVTSHGATNLAALDRRCERHERARSEFLRSKPLMRLFPLQVGRGIFPLFSPSKVLGHLANNCAIWLRFSTLVWISENFIMRFLLPLWLLASGHAEATLLRRESSLGLSLWSQGREADANQSLQVSIALTVQTPTSEPKRCYASPTQRHQIMADICQQKTSLACLSPSRKPFPT